MFQAWAESPDLLRWVLTPEVIDFLVGTQARFAFEFHRDAILCFSRSLRAEEFPPLMGLTVALCDAIPEAVWEAFPPPGQELPTVTAEPVAAPSGTFHGWAIDEPPPFGAEVPIAVEPIAVEPVAEPAPAPVVGACGGRAGGDGHPAAGRAARADRGGAERPADPGRRTGTGRHGRAASPSTTAAPPPPPPPPPPHAPEVVDETSVFIAEAAGEMTPF